MQQIVLKAFKGFSIVFLLASMLSVASIAQAGNKYYRGGLSVKFGHKGSYGYGNKYKPFYSKSYRNNYSYGKKSSYNNSYKPRYRSYSTGRSTYQNNHFPYRNYAFRSKNGYSDKSFSSKRVIVPHLKKKHAATIVIAGAAAGIDHVSEAKPKQTESNEHLTCYDYRLTSVGGVGGFKFDNSDSAIKVANDNTIAGEFCGSNFVEFELAKVDANVAINFEFAGNTFEFPVNADSVQEDGWQKKFFSVDLKPSN